MSSAYMDDYNGYQVKPHKDTPSHYVIVTAGKGGKIPDILSGMFTTKQIAKKAIDAYLLGKPKKETNNGEEVNKG